ENFLRFVPNRSLRNIHVHGFHRRRTRSRLDSIPAKCSILKCHEPRWIAIEADIRREFSLKHLPREQQLVAFFAISNAVADYGPTHRRRQFRNEIAYLVRVWHEHQARLLCRNELFQPFGKPFGRVRTESGGFQGMDLRNFFGGNFAGNCTNAVSRDGSFKRPSHLSRERLSRDKGFPGNSVEVPFTLFDNY